MGETRGLVRYPTTLAPVRESIQVATQCADNAHKTSLSLNVLCNSDGSWSSAAPTCQCNEGYNTITGTEICEGLF